jgi:hypothetical protein
VEKPWWAKNVWNKMTVSCDLGGKGKCGNSDVANAGLALPEFRRAGFVGHAPR